MEEVILTFDQGNTRAKLSVFRIMADGGCRVEGEFRYESAPTVEDVAELVETYGISGAIYCSVGHIDVRFVETLRGLICGELIILTHRTPLPVTISYATPSSLGFDRIAAAVGAVELLGKRNIMIVDAGTAVTEDLVTVSPENEVCFLGGRISPGLRMRFRSLHELTSRLPLIDSHGETPVVGRSTELSIRSGVVRGLVSEIDGTFAEYRSLCQSSELTMILTGGDAPLLSDLISEKAEVCQNLNDIGLCAIYRHNSGKFA